MPREEASTEIQELDKLHTQIRTWRNGLTLVFGVVTAASLFVMYGAINGLATDGPKQQEFTTALASKLTRDVLPDAEQLGVNALHEVDFQGEFSKLNGRAPELANASVTQLQLLSKDLPERSQQVISDEVDASIQARAAKLHQLFPEATDEQVASVLTSITGEAHSQVADLTTDLFQPHVDALNGIVDDLGKIHDSEAPHIKGQTPTWQMAFLVSDIARDELAGVGDSSKIDTGKQN